MGRFISLENLWKLSHLFFIFLIALTFCYALERVCYIDSSYMLFRMINDEQLVAEGGRWMNVLPQFIPWIFIKTGLSLKVIVLCFSSMHMIVPYFIFLLIGKFFKQRLTAILFLLLMVVSVNETFFDVVTETRYSLAFGISFLAFLQSEKNKQFLLGFILVFCGFFSHPTFILYFLIIILFFKLLNYHFNLFKYFLTGTIIFIVKYLLIGATKYENNLLYDAFQNLSSTFSSSFIHHYFNGLLFTQFVFLIIISFVLIYQFIKTRKYAELGIYLFVVLALYFLLCLLYSKGDSQMMIQKTLILFHFVIVLPIFFFWQQLTLFLQKTLLISIFFAFIFAFNGILNLSEKYTDRVHILTDFMKELPNNSDKFLIKESSINHDKIMATWALPHETIMLSNILLGKNITLKNFRETNDTLLFSKFPNAFRPAFGYPIVNSHLNQAYFKLDTTKLIIWVDSTTLLGDKPMP